MTNEKIIKEILILKEQFLDKINKILEKLDYSTEKSILSTDIEFIYPYLEYLPSLDIKTLEKFIFSPRAHAFKFFYSTQVIPIINSVGNLVCPLYTDKINGIQNEISFNEHCLNDLIEYFLEVDNSFFVEYVTTFLTNISTNPTLLRKYGISLSAKEIDDLSLDTNLKLKRLIVIEYLKIKNGQNLF